MIKVKISKTQTANVESVGKQMKVSITFQVCSILAQKEYKLRHDNVVKECIEEMLTEYVASKM